MNRFFLFLQALSQLGVSDTLQAQERRYVQQLNRLTLLISLLILSMTVPSLIMLPNTWFMVILTLIFPMLCLLVYVFQSRRCYTAARVYFVSLSILDIFVTSLWMGPDTLNHLYLLAVSIGTFYIFPTRQTRLAVGFSVLAILAMLTVEVVFEFTSYRGMLNSLEQSISRYVSLIGFSCMITLMALQNFLTLNRAEERATHERERSESVLRRIFPRHIFEQLKNENEILIAERFDHVSVMFIDIVGFTEMSAKADPETLIRFLDDVFSEMDAAARQHDVEKIKTVGDAYMIAGGLRQAGNEKTSLDEGRRHLMATIDCALSILQRMEHRRFKFLDEEIRVFVRIGIHFGPVVAGVFGEQKFSYDIWGDTVNTAQRMETHSKAGQIQVSSSVIEQVGDAFVWKAQGKTIIKGKGTMETFHILSRSELISDEHQAAS